MTDDKRALEIQNKMVKESTDYLFDVSIIVLTYNPRLSKLFKTLDSVIYQKKLSFEIILCDDGSNIQFSEKVNKYFLVKDFKEYTLVFHNHNSGTVENFYSGLEIAKGKYTKTISPGDYFTDETVLYRWIRFMESKKLEWSFSDVFFYSGDRVLRKKAHPQIIKPYLKNEKKKCIWNYLIYRDCATGAAIIGTTKIQLAYCKLIKENDVKYAEDAIWRLMMFRGVVGCYYPNETIFYEYGTGISTSNSLFWKQKLIADRDATYNIMSNERKLSSFQKSIIKTKFHSRSIEKIFHRGGLYHSLKCHFFPRLTKFPKKKK